MKTMLRNLTAIALLLGLSMNAKAQDSTSQRVRPITSQGSYAFIFAVNGLSDLDLGAPAVGVGAEGIGYGVKHFVADNFALRVISGYSGKNIISDNAEDVVTKSLTSGLGLEYHLDPLYSISPYYGIQFGLVSNTGENANFMGQTVKEYDQLTLTGTILAGVNWFFTDGLALGFEYGGGVNLKTGSYTTAEDVKTDLPDEFNTGYAGSAAVNFIAYF